MFLQGYTVHPGVTLVLRIYMLRAFDHFYDFVELNGRAFV